MVDSYRYVEVEVRVHTQDHHALGGLRYFGADSPHVPIPFHVALTSRPEERERTDDTVRGHATGGELL
jgi:hypothetical protein